MVVTIQGTDLEPSISLKTASELDENLATFKWLITYAVGEQPDIVNLQRLKHNFLRSSEVNGENEASKYFNARNPVED